MTERKMKRRPTPQHRSGDRDMTFPGYDEWKTHNPEDWRPISTAPKSTSEPCAGGHQVRGVYFLAYCPDESVTDSQGCMCVCWWEPHMHGVYEGGWQGEGDYELRPTHWMPLPSRGPDSAKDDDKRPTRRLRRDEAARRDRQSHRLRDRD